MDRDDIIKMAREAGFADGVAEIVGLEGFARFAALVAAEKEKQIIDILRRLQERNDSHNYYAYAINVIKVAAAEREACAKVVEDYCGAWDDGGYALAATIRVRGMRHD